MKNEFLYKATEEEFKFRRHLGWGLYVHVKERSLNAFTFNLGKNLGKLTSCLCQNLAKILKQQWVQNALPIQTGKLKT